MLCGDYSTGGRRTEAIVNDVYSVGVVDSWVLSMKTEGPKSAAVTREVI